MGSFSPVHWLIVIAIILLLFGPSRIAGLGKGLGEGIRSFKKGISEDPPEGDKTDPKQLAESKGENNADAKQESKSS